MFEYVKEFLKMNDVEYRENVNLKSLSPIKIGGNAKIIAYPNSAFKYVQVLRFLGTIKCKFRTLGRMSNLLPSDDGYDGVIIKTDRIRRFYITSNILYTYCGITTAILAAETCRAELSGFEELSGIPGSIGGAIFGNAGAFGREIADVVSDVTFYSPADDRVYTASAGEIDFSYRNSAFKSGLGYIISARLNLTHSDTDSVAARMKNVKETRERTQPVGELSLGSTFKRPESDLPAAKMIDECGLKGYRIGGAEISKKHAGFIINRDGALAEDYLRLADYASDEVYEKFGVRLEREVELL